MINKEDILTDEGKVICDLTNIFANKNKEIERLNNVINETRRILGQYAHYSTPTEEQNAKNEAIVDYAYMQLHNNLKESKGDE